MKRILRHIVIETLGVYFANQIASGLQFQDPMSGILITGAALGVAAYLIKPIVNLLILPLTLATLGLFKFVGSAITLYIVDVGLPQFAIGSFSFPGLTSQYLDLPALSFNEGVLSYLAFSLVISILTTTFHWLVK